MDLIASFFVVEILNKKIESENFEIKNGIYTLY